MMDTPPKLIRELSSLNMGATSTGNSPALVGIIVGSIIGVMVLLCLVYCCRKERQTKSYGLAHPQARRGTIVKLEETLPEDHDHKELSNVSKAKLRREIEECLVHKTVIMEEDGEDTNKNNSFMESLANSDRVYSSFVAAALSVSSSKKSAATFEDSNMVDIEVGDTTNTVTPTDNSPPRESLQRRKSNRLARGLSVSLAKKKEFTKQCFLCLGEYTNGNQVCGSPNPKCPHAYHKECIVEWLMKRDACPLCCEDFKKCGSDTVEADKGIEDFKKLPDADKGTE